MLVMVVFPADPWRKHYCRRASQDVLKEIRARRLQDAAYLSVVTHAELSIKREELKNRNDDGLV